MDSSAITLQDRVEFRIVSDPSPFQSASSPAAVVNGGKDAPLLQLQGVRKAYGGVEAVSGVDLGLIQGRITGLIGPNGAGKTTLLNVISGVERATAGRIQFLGDDIGSLPQHRLAAKGLVRTFQISRELGRLSVLENLLLARASQTGEGLIGLFVRPGKVRREEEAAI
jgi:branched-chain amino acid transport system ATP-binding protein